MHYVVVIAVFIALVSLLYF